MSKKLTKRAEDYSKWYNEIILKADLAENSAVRGCMVIKPYGFAIWENMQKELDRMFKETGHQNAYFPLFVPKSLFEAEEKNAEGFAKECAVVTHYRLQNDPEKEGKLRVDPEAKLDEELIVRPTSEAIIWNTYKGWIHKGWILVYTYNGWIHNEIHNEIHNGFILYIQRMDTKRLYFLFTTDGFTNGWIRKRLYFTTDGFTTDLKIAVPNGGHRGECPV